jgi:hypothetical protein
MRYRLRLVGGLFDSNGSTPAENDTAHSLESHDSTLNASIAVCSSTDMFIADVWDAPSNDTDATQSHLTLYDVSLTSPASADLTLCTLDSCAALEACDARNVLDDVSMSHVEMTSTDVFAASVRPG